MRLTRVVIASVALVALVAPVAGAGAAPPAAGDFVTVEFSGSVHAHYDTTLNLGYGQISKITNDLSYIWRESTVEPIVSVTNAVLGEAEDAVTGSGTVVETSTTNPKQNCTETLQELADTKGSYATGESGVRVDRVPRAGAPGIDGVQLTATLPIDTYELSGDCNPYLDDAMQLGPIHEVAENNRFSCVINPHGSCDKTLAKSGSVPMNEGSYTYTVTALFHASRTAAAEPPPVTPQKDAAKDAAGQDFSNIYFGKALEFCYPRMVDISEPGAVVETVTFSGAPWVDSMCSALLSRMQQDHSIFNDPPRADYLDLARVQVMHLTRVQLQSCAQANASARSLCLGVSSAGGKEAAAEQHVAAVTAAIATTVARESAAQQAGDRSAIALQERQLAKLESQLNQARQAEATTSLALAEQLRALHVSGSISQALYTQALAVVSKRLAGLGITQSELGQAILGGKPPTPPDLLAVLGDSSSPAVATPPPASASGIITSVAFSGSPANPTITVQGSNLGSAPAPSPAGHPSGLNGCPTIAGDHGYDFGTSLYIAVPAGNWFGGRYQPATNETDCIDLIVTRFTATEVVFKFGPFYTSTYPRFSLASGDVVQVEINGASHTASVKYR